MKFIARLTLAHSMITGLLCTSVLGAPPSEILFLDKVPQKYQGQLLSDAQIEAKQKNLHAALTEIVTKLHEVSPKEIGTLAQLAQTHANKDRSYYFHQFMNLGPSEDPRSLTPQIKFVESTHLDCSFALTYPTLGKYTLVVPTGLIRLIFAELPAQQDHNVLPYLERGFRILAGIFAREYSRYSSAGTIPQSDSQANDGFDRLMRAQYTQTQYEEARIDAIAIELLRNAKYPREGIIEGINMISAFNLERVNPNHAWVPQSSQATAYDGLSTRPPEQLRAALGRQLSTLDVLQRGNYAYTPFLNLSSTQSEIQTMMHEGPAPHNLSEALDQMEKLFKNQWSPPLSKERGPAATTMAWVLYYLKESSEAGSMTAGERTRFFDLHAQFVEALMQWQHEDEHSNNWGWNFWEPVLHPKVSPEIRKTLLNTLPIFRDPAYLNPLKKITHKALVKDFSPPTKITKLYGMMPTDEAIDWFSREVFPQYFELFESVAFSESEEILLMRKIAPRLRSATEVQLERIVLWRRGGPFSDLFSFNFMATMKNPPDSQDPSLKILAKLAWKYRADIAEAEFEHLIAGRSSAKLMNWPAVLSALEIPENEGKQKILAAFVQKNERTKKVHKMLYPKGLDTHGRIGFSWLKSVSDIGNWSPLYWDDPKLAVSVCGDGGHELKLHSEGVRKLAIFERHLSENLELSGTLPVQSRQAFLSRFSCITGSQFRAPSRILADHISTAALKNEGSVISAIVKASNATFDTFNSPRFSTVSIDGRHEQSHHWRAGKFMQMPAHFQYEDKKFEEHTGDLPIEIDLPLAQWIDALDIESAIKGRIFRALLDEWSSENSSLNFLEPKTTALVLKHGGFASFKAYYERAFQSGVSYHSVEKHQKEESETKSKRMGQFYRAFFEAMDSSVLREFETLKSQGLTVDEAMTQLGPFLAPLDPATQQPMKDASELRDRDHLRLTKRAVVEWILSQSDPLTEKDLSHFSVLTLTGGTEETDRYLRKLLAQFEAGRPSQEDLFTRSVRAAENHVLSERLKYELCKKDIDLALSSAGESLFSESDYRPKRAIVDIALRWLPEPTLDRNDVLEDLAWKLGIDTIGELEWQIEFYKVPRARTAFPIQMRLASVISEIVRRGTDEFRLSLIRYVVRPTAEARREIEPQIHAILETIQPESKLAAPMVEMVVEFPREATPLKKVPVLEFLLGSVSAVGGPAFIEVPHYRSQIVEEILGHAPKGLQSRFLEAYLRSVASHERASVLAYLLAHSQEPGQGYRSIFEVFTTVGVKVGQLASIWNLFESEEIKRDLEVLKDRAQPMDKIEILKSLKKALPPKEYQKIKSVPKRLGSASIKTVAQVQFGNGNKVVAMIRRPYAKSLVKENIRRGNLFLDELESEFVNEPRLLSKVRSIRSMLYIVNQELEGELEFETEVERVKRAGQVFGKNGRPGWSGSTDGLIGKWRIVVPQAVSPVYGPEKGSPSNDPQVILMEWADGKPLDELEDPVSRAEAGRIIVSLSLRGLFQNGFFNADPHRGNFLAKQGTLFMFDFGQAESFEHNYLLPGNDLLVLAHFLVAVHERDAERIAQLGTSMAVSSENTPTLDLAGAIREAVSTNPQPMELVTKTIQVFGEAGHPLQKKFFGVLKGLAILSQEEYVPEQEFQDLLAEEVKRALVKESVGNAANSTWRWLRNFVSSEQD